jgi:hypothetical protein
VQTRAENAITLAATAILRALQTWPHAFLWWSSLGTRYTTQLRRSKKMQLEYIWFATMAYNSRRTAPLKDKMSQIKSFHLRPPSLDKGLIRVRSHLNSRKSSSPQMKTLRLTQELSRKPILFLKRKSSPRRKVRLRTLVQTHQKKIKQSNYSNREKIMR